MRENKRSSVSFSYLPCSDVLDAQRSRCAALQAAQRAATQASDTNALLGCRALLSHVLAQSTVNSFGSREELVQIWIDQHNVRAFAVTLGVLSANAGLD